MPLSAFSYCLSPSSSFHLRTPFCTTYCLFPKSFCSFSFKFAYNSSKLGSWRTSPNFTKEEPTIIETECGHNLLLDGAKKKKGIQLLEVIISLWACPVYFVLNVNCFFACHVFMYWQWIYTNHISICSCITGTRHQWVVFGLRTH